MKSGENEPQTFAERAKFLGWLFCLCFSLAGVQFCYSIQFALGTPLFHDQLRIDQSTISVILSTAGPISGLIVQPIVGAWSDGLSTRWGRRRPFVAIGSLFCALGMGLIAISVNVGELMGDDPDGSSASDHSASIALAIIGLWIMNLFVNTIQGPARAIVADLVPSDKQQDGNAMVSCVMGLAAIIANVVGAQLFLTDAPYRNLFLIGLACVLLSAVPTLIVAREGPRAPVPGEAGISPVAIFAKIWHAFRTIPRKMVIVVVVFFLSWCAYSPFMIYLTDYFGIQIYKGGSSEDLKPAYQDGVQMGMYGLAVFSAVQWAFSFALAPLVAKCGAHLTYATTQLLATGVYAGLFFLTHNGDGLSRTAIVAIAFVLMGAAATNFTTMNSVPFGLVRGLTGAKDAGLYMGVLNAASVVAQTATNLIAGQIIGACPHDAPHDSQNVAYSFLVGAGLSVIAVVAAVFLPKVDESDATSEERQPLAINRGDADTDAVIAVPPAVDGSTGNGYGAV